LYGNQPHVEYALTPLGRSLLEVVGALADWARRNRNAIEAARANFDGRAGEAHADDGAKEVSG
jgi:DNA-binding HxlR family transcriptional regulator